MPRHSTQLTAAIDTRLRTKQGKEKKVCRPRKLRKVPFLYPLPVSPDPRAFFQQRQIFHSSVVPLPPGARLGSRVARLLLNESMQRSAYRVLTQCRAATERQQQAAAPSRRCQTFYCFSFFLCFTSSAGSSCWLRVSTARLDYKCVASKCACVCVCQTYVCFVHRMKGTCSSLLFP